MIDKIVYTNDIKKLLDNPRQFKKLNIDPSKELNFVLNCEQKFIDILKEIKNKNQINEDLYTKLRPVGSQPGVIYGLTKVHEKVIDGCPAFRPILSAIRTPMYKIAKFLVPITKDLTSNKYSGKDSFDFAKEILQQNFDCFMASLDITSLFTNIPLDETINICSNELFDKKKYVSNLDRTSFEKLLQLSTKESFFIFDKTFYKRLDGVVMGFPLGPTLANAFLCYHEKIWLDKCPVEFNPVFYRRYVDEIFVLFRKE